jgi:hypothetical protein
MGTVNVSEQGEKLRLVTDQRAWNVDNPEPLKIAEMIGPLGMMLGRAVH